MVGPPTIEHLVDVIEGDDGRIEQVYNYLLYRFATEPETVVRCYLDTPTEASVLTHQPVSAPIRAYLRERFATIRQLGPQGYGRLA